MKILMIHAHTENRGDEAAVKGAIEVIHERYNEAQITISYNGKTFYPNLPSYVDSIIRLPKLESMFDKIDFMFIVATGGKLSLTSNGRRFLKCLKNSNIVLHAPGGPSIGNIYEESEWLYLMRLNICRKNKIPYMFYAPSMGPFGDSKHDKLRKKILNDAACIVVRDPISKDYVESFLGKKILLALDSALQNEIEIENNQSKINQYKELNEFLGKHEKIIGITITDLKWHPIHKNDIELEKTIQTTFIENINQLTNEGYGIVFIPQLYGELDDEKTMREYAVNDSCFTVTSKDVRFDSGFQQYLISRLYAVIGMRYHSNIFSAKAGIPFISISYEQKMYGFMLEMGLEDYCISLSELSSISLKRKIKLLNDNYEEYRDTLITLRNVMIEKSRLTSEALFDLLDSK